MDEIRFRSDLYSDAAEYYERCRRDYPSGLLRQLVDAAVVSGHGRLLDLACGTGQVTFGLNRHFDEVWAVDQEPEMIRVGRSKAARLGVTNITWFNRPAEDVEAPSGSFELITVGNAFHRLPRQLIARKAFDWLSPLGCIVLLWGGTPWEKGTQWQRAMSETLGRWMESVGAADRVPAGWEEARLAKPDAEVLADAGFDVLGRFGARVTLEWTAEQLVGFVYSTSVLSRSLLGDRAPEFEDDLCRSLAGSAGDEPYLQETEFDCDLARRPQAPSG